MVLVSNPGMVLMSGEGYITSDDYSAYNKYVDKSRWQLCWAHMIRKFRKLAEGEGEEKVSQRPAP